MNPTPFKLSFFGFGLLGRKLTCLLLCLLFTQVVLAQTYVNNTNANYVIPGPPSPPQIDATAFDNESQFNVSFSIFSPNTAEYVEPWWGTLFFTNNGEMSVNAPGESIFGGQLTTFGFEFDLQQADSNTTNMLADTFYNTGTIDNDSILEGNFAPGNCLIQATNVVDSGVMNIGAGGTLAINGQNVNLNRSVISMESPEIEFVAGNTEGFPNAPFTGTGASGIYTNVWDPSIDLTFNQALSADFPLFPDGFFLPNSLPYNQQTGANLNRSAFVENDSPPNVTYNVYFGANSVSNIIGVGDATIEFVGTYLNYATGQQITNYLYLNDDYVAGAVTNVPLGPGGWPRNFVLTQSPVELIASPAPSPVGLPVFPVGGITNNPYVFGEFLGNGVGLTNISPANPSGSITNLLDNVQIVATRELNLNFAQITGLEYLSLTATNQFDGSTGADIDPIFSDMNLASTNGSMTISNLIEPQIQDWNGNIEAWSTRWFNVVSNFVIVFSNSVPTTNIVVETNDWRTVLMDGNLNPDTPPQVRNLTLGATNSLVISDVLNIFGSFFASAQSLTLTTNVEGTGAGSPDGELDLQNANPIGWSWNGSTPNLLWLTNNGAIRLPGFSQFIASTQMVMITSNIPATLAMATLSAGKGLNIAKNKTVTIGTTTYVFTNSITSKSPAYAVLIGSNFKASMTNLIAAINFSAGGNKVYSTNKSFANGFVTASKLVGTNFTVSALSADAGPNGNLIPVGTTATNLVWSALGLSPADLLAGGSNAVPGMTNFVATPAPYGAIINNGLLSDQGSTIWATNFQSGGVILNGVGPFNLTSATTTLTNGILQAGGNISIAGTTVIITNLALQAGGSLTLDAPLLLTDFDVSNANVWTVGGANGTGGNGLELPVKPQAGDLLGETIEMTAPAPNQLISSTWAATDDGVSTAGYTNNEAIGQLILDAVGPNSSFSFSGIGTANAIYVDRLVLEDYASYANGEGTHEIPNLLFNTNLVIYYADAVASSTVTGGPLTEVSFQLNNSNGGHLLWVPEFAGLFSATNLAYPNGANYKFNIGLVQSPLDSDGSGMANAQNPQPFFVASELNFASAAMKSGIKLTWNSIPSSTNTVFYTTNLVSWSVVTNFVSPSAVPPVGGWPITNVLNEPIYPSSHGYYWVRVSPNSADVYGQ